MFTKIGDIGEEFGATTGRRRQCNWMNMQTLERAIRINGVTHLVFNKMDVLREVREWALIDRSKVKKFSNEKDLKEFVVRRLKPLGLAKNRIYFSEHKDRI